MMARNRYAALPVAAALSALVALTGCAPAEQDDPIVVLPADMGPDTTPADMAPADMAEPDLGPPARVLVERDPLPFRTDNRFVNPGFDPRSPQSWLSAPTGSRVVDHRLPFRGPALYMEPVGEQGAFFGQVRLSSQPIELSIWIGVSPGGGTPEDAHPGRVLAEFEAFTPDREPVEAITYQLLRTGDPIVGPRNLVWQRYTGGTRRPTLGWGSILVYAARDQRLAIGAPRAVLEEVDPAALRTRVPEMPVVAGSAEMRARRDALTRRPTPRPPRPVSDGPRGFPARGR